jgi:hypothetical protein
MVLGVGRGEECLDGMDRAVRVDGLEALGRDLNLGLTERAGEGVELTVGVADADFVEIDQGELADSTAGEGFGGPGTDAAEADNADVGMAQAFGAGNTDQALDAAETSLERVHCGLGKRKLDEKLAMMNGGLA